MTEHYLKDELYELIKKDDAIFDFIQTASLDGMWYWDLENPEHKWMNTKFWTTLGYDPEDMPHRAEAWQDIINQDDFQVALDNFHKHCADPNHPYDQVVRYRHKDGSTVWIRCRGMAIRDENGTPIRMLGAHNDITKLTEAERQMTRDTQRYKRLVESQSAYLITLNLEGNYTYVNDYYCDDFGWPRETLLGHASSIGVVEEDQAVCKWVGQECFANPGKRIKARLRKVDPNGVIRTADWEFTAQLAEGSLPPELICVGIDVTEQVKAEAALKASEAQFRFIAENTSDGILMFNYDKIVYASPAYTRILGYSLAEEKAYTQEDIYALLHPEDRERIRTLVNNAVDKQQQQLSYEYRALHKDGHYVWREDRATLLYDADGLPVQSILMARDITERKQAEVALQRTTTLLNDAQRIAKLGGWELDVATDQAILSDQLYAIYELPVGTPITGTEAIAYYHPDDQPLITQAINQTIEHHVPFDVQYRFITAKGTHRWMWASGYPVVENDHVTRVIGTFQDITGQKQLEKYIRESEQQLFSTIASMDDDVFVLDNEGVFKEIYSAINSNFYLEKLELLDQAYDTVLPPALAEIAREVLFKAEHSPDTKTFAFDYSLEHNGCTHWYSAKATTRFGLGGKFDGVTVVARDITEQREAETALRESENRYRLLAENSKDLISLRRLDNTLIYASPAYERLLGYDRDELVMLRPEEVLHPDDVEMFLAAHQALRDGHTVQKLQYRFKKKDGTYLWIEVYASYVTDEASGEQRILATSRDITERKQAEDALRASEQQLDFFFNQSLTGFFFTRLDEPIMWDGAEDKEALLEYIFDHQRVIKANQAFFDQYDDTDHTLLGFTPKNFFTHDMDQGKTVLKKLFDTGHLHVVTKERRTDGSSVFIEGDYICMYDDQGRLTGHFGVQQNVTSRKKAERALAASEAKFRSFVENANDVIFTLNPEGNLLYVSPTWEAVKGFSAEGLVGTSFVPLVHPDDTSSTLEALRTIVMSKEAYSGLIYRSKHGDGSWHWFAANGAPIFDEHGNVTTILVITRDITSDKTAEQAMHATLKRLEQALANNDLLMKELHHRVKNNLAIIASLLALRARGLKDDAAKNALRESRTRIVAMSEIHELMYRQDSSKTIAFHDYLASLVERMNRSFGHLQGISFSFASPEVDVSFDQAIPLGLIVNELLTNATKYAFAEERPNPHVDITVTIDDGLTLTVTDNGAGLADESVLETSDSLGMTVIHSLTDQLSGHVVFQNRPNPDIGLQVTLQMPLVKVNVLDKRAVTQ